MENQNKNQVSPEMLQYIKDKKNEQVKKSGEKPERTFPQGVSPEMRQLIEDRDKQNK
jgi:hypothetical protein